MINHETAVAVAADQPEALMRVLLVEDDTATSASIKMMLKKEIDRRRGVQFAALAAAAH